MHLWGQPCATDELQQIADENGIDLFYDAAHAFGCTHQGRMIGGFGRAEVFSFHATKYVNAFEGGAIVTDDAGLADRMRSMRSFGFADWDVTDGIGTNGKMSEASAAMGLTSLDAMGDILAVNRANITAYEVALAGIPGVTLLKAEIPSARNNQHVILRINPRVAPLSRDTLQQVLVAEGILARRYFYPGCHRMQPYVGVRPGGPERLPVTEAVSEEVLSLPTGLAVSADDVREISQVIRSAMDDAAAIRRRFSTQAAS